MKKTTNNYYLEVSATSTNRNDGGTMSITWNDFQGPYNKLLALRERKRLLAFFKKEKYDDYSVVLKRSEK